MKAKHVILLIAALLLLAGVIGTTMYVMSAIKDEIDITDTANKVFANFKAKALEGNVDTLSAKENKMAENWSEVKSICFDTMNDIVLGYARSDYGYQKSIVALRCYALFPVTQSELDAFTDRIDNIENGREAYKQALNENDPMTAATLYIKVDKEDSSYYTLAKTKLQETLNIDALRTQTLEKLSKNQIESALDDLRAIDAMWDVDESVKEIISNVERYRDTQEKTVNYTGQVEVLSVRNLMAFPEIVYAEGSAYADSYDSSLITPKEFKTILSQLYNNDYILVSINSFNGDNLNSIEIPSGKKPFILIIEDLTYPSANLGSGVCGRLTIDKTGELCTVTDSVSSYDNESVLILEAFLREHPDFTYKGARGCISLTGYSGIFGYDIKTDEGKAEAQRVAEYLKTQGWTFACQSYSYADMQNATQDTLKWDTEKWAELVSPIVGKAEVYVWPYGSHVRSGEKHSYLYEQGYRIFLGLGITPYRAVEPDSMGIFFDRRSLTGYALRTYAEEYSHLFNADEVIDSVRPKKDRDDHSS